MLNANRFQNFVNFVRKKWLKINERVRSFAVLIFSILNYLSLKYESFKMRNVCALEILLPFYEYVAGPIDNPLRFCWSSFCWSSCNKIACSPVCGEKLRVPKAGLWQGYVAYTWICLICLKIFSFPDSICDIRRYGDLKNYSTIEFNARKVVVVPPDCKVFLVTLRVMKNVIHSRKPYPCHQQSFGSLIIQKEKNG